MKILIVDDSKAMRTFLEHLVRTLQCDAALAEDGVNALEVLAASGPFDLVLIDWDMPRMNGHQLVEAIRADARYAGLKLMMVTTQNSHDRVVAALAAGADDYLMKPVTRELLEDKLRLLGVVA